MGYYTRHKLEVIEGDNGLIEKLREKFQGAEYAITDTGDTYEESKWYSREGDMKFFSLSNPNALFKLSGKGDESGDLWECYFKAGKMQKCKAKISYDEFDESKLC